MGVSYLVSYEYQVRSETPAVLRGHILVTADGPAKDYSDIEKIMRVIREKNGLSEKHTVVIMAMSRLG